MRARALPYLSHMRNFLEEAHWKTAAPHRSRMVERRCIERRLGSARARAGQQVRQRSPAALSFFHVAPRDRVIPAYSALLHVHLRRMIIKKKKEKKGRSEKKREKEKIIDDTHTRFPLGKNIFGKLLALGNRNKYSRTGTSIYQHLMFSGIARLMRLDLNFTSF